MLTKDPKLACLFDQRADKRVQGFAYGYNCVFGKSKDFLTDKEYQQGWDEGKSLRFDEMKADARAQGWKIK
jgi:hypothetical protein